MTTLARRRGALLFTQIVELSARMVLPLMLVMELAEVLDLDPGERGLMIGVLGIGSLVTQVLGGALADRWLGYRRAALGGAALMALAYALLSLDARLPIRVGLVVLVLGQGLFRNSVPVLLGELHAPGDPRRDTDFLLFSFIPVVGLVVPSAVGALRQHLSWTAVMLIVAALLGGSALLLAWAHPAEPPRASPPPEEPPPEETPLQVKSARTRLLIVLFVGTRALLSWLPLLLGVFIKAPLQKIDMSAHWTSLIAFTLLSATLPLLTLGVFAVLEARGAGLRTADKLALGMLLIAASYVVLLLGALVGDAGDSSFPWVLLSMVASTLGQRLLGAMLLSLAVQHLPPRWKATLLGFFFLESAPGPLALGVVFTAWPSVPGLGLVVVLALGAALLWRSRGRALVEASEAPAG